MNILLSASDSNLSLKKSDHSLNDESLEKLLVSLVILEESDKVSLDLLLDLGEESESLVHLSETSSVDSR